MNVTVEPSKVILVIGEDAADSCKGLTFGGKRGGEFLGIANLVEVNGFFEKAIGDYGAKSCGGLVYGGCRPEAELKAHKLTNTVEVFGSTSVSELGAVLGAFVVVARAEFVLGYFLALDFEFAAVEGVGDVKGVLNLRGGLGLHCWSPCMS